MTFNELPKLSMEPRDLSFVVIFLQILGPQRITDTELSEYHLDERAHTLIIPVLTARNICISASSEVPDVVFCTSAGTQGGGS